tara:strand:+ start:1055 stop:1351 length:297 start_codon:yes stop_codon:yes gene_type:complete
MADVFQIGEHVICSITVKDADGVLQDAATSMNIKINKLRPNYEGDVLSNRSMTKDSTGTYHYDFASAGEYPGDYQVVYTATDGSRITIQKDDFVLEGV